MRHTVKQGIKYITHVHIQAMTIRMNSDIDNMLKDDQDNIQAREINMSNQTIYDNESIHARRSEQSWQKSESICQAKQNEQSLQSKCQYPKQI